jgi:membrane-associated phospholipid phosphatase
MRAAAVLFLLCPVWLPAQQTDSGGASASSDPQAATPLAAPPAPVEREVSWHKLPENLIEDQRAIWLAPLKLKERKYWLPTAAVLGITAGLVVGADPPVAKSFRYDQAFHHFNNTFAGNRTSLAILVAPLSMYGAGLVGRDSKLKSTALLAGEAVADSEILTTVLKSIDRRTRPAGVHNSNGYGDTWFEDHSGGWRGNGSFPSGHTIAAMSVATVIAQRYGNHKWVPYVAYGTAAVIGFSRLTLSAHFSSDVFMGGVLGYSISRFVVLRQ